MLNCKCKAYPMAFQDDEIWYKVSGCDIHYVGEFIRDFPEGEELEKVKQYIRTHDDIPAFKNELYKIPGRKGYHPLSNKCTIKSKKNKSKTYDTTSKKIVKRFLKTYECIRIKDKLHFRQRNKLKVYHSKNDIKDILISRFHLENDINNVVDAIYNKIKEVII